MSQSPLRCTHAGGRGRHARPGDDHARGAELPREWGGPHGGGGGDGGGGGGGRRRPRRPSASPARRHAEHGRRQQQPQDGARLSRPLESGEPPAAEGFFGREQPPDDDGAAAEGPIGPVLPLNLLGRSWEAGGAEAEPVGKDCLEDEEDEAAYAPALPPDMIEARLAAAAPPTPPRRRPPAGPALPAEGLAGRRRSEEDQDDYADEDYGPEMPTDGVADDLSAVNETIERIENRARQSKDGVDPDASDVKQKRGDWMLVPPKNTALADLLKAPQAMMKSRAFSKREHEYDDGGSSEWTETPDERAARIRDGKDTKRKRREKEPVSAQVLERDRRTRREVIEHDKQNRPKSLMEMHAENMLKDRKYAEHDVSQRAWDRDRDINSRQVSSSALRGRLTQAGNLDSRFSGSRTGSYM